MGDRPDSSATTILQSQSPIPPPISKSQKSANGAILADKEQKAADSNSANVENKSDDHDGSNARHPSGIAAHGLSDEASRILDLGARYVAFFSLNSIFGLFLRDFLFFV